MDSEDVEPKRRIMREHILQARGVVPWATKAALDIPFEFMSFDSAGKQTDSQRIFGAARGITKATPDTVLFLNLELPLWVELKWGDAKPDADQLVMHDRLRSLGHEVYVANSVMNFCIAWLEAGVPLRPGARLAAEQYDAKVAAVIARLEGAAPAKKSRPRKAPPRFTAGRRLSRRIHAG